MDQSLKAYDQNALNEKIAINRKLYPPGKPVQGHDNLALSLEVLGIVYLRTGEYANAERLLREEDHLERTQDAHAVMRMQPRTTHSRSRSG